MSGKPAGTGSVVQALRAAIGRSGPQAVDILDLRHFSALQLRPLLQEESERWAARLHWDYSAAREMLLGYIDGRVLPGFAAIDNGRVVGYAFAVCEAEKSIIGDVYALGESDEQRASLCDTLLQHLLDMLQAMPGTERIESQLLMFPAGTLTPPFQLRGFHRYERLFMFGPTAATTASASLPEELVMEPWQPQHFGEAADLVHRAYAGHIDSGINDQYRDVAGSLRFLHNIVRFPGCGEFAPEHSWTLRRRGTQRLEGLLLTSRLRAHTAHITQLCLSPGYQGHGLGALLTRHAISGMASDGLTELSLTVTAANTAAVHLYQRLGLSPLHRFDAFAWQAHSDPD